MSPYVRTVKTSSGATAVQIVYSFSKGSRQIEHLGSAHDDAGVELLKAAARQRLAAGQGELDLGLSSTSPSGAAVAVGVPRAAFSVTGARVGDPWGGLGDAYPGVGVESAPRGGGGVPGPGVGPRIHPAPQHGHP